MTGKILLVLRAPPYFVLFLAIIAMGVIWNSRGRPSILAVSCTPSAHLRRSDILHLWGVDVLHDPRYVFLNDRVVVWEILEIV